MDIKQHTLQLNARTLGELDNGKVGLAIDHAIKQVIADVVARCGDNAKRSVSIKIHATPETSQSDTALVLDTIKLKVEVSQSVPKRANSKPYHVLPMGDGTARFSSQCPHDPRQMPMFDSSPSPGEKIDIGGAKVDVSTGEVEDDDDQDDDDQDETSEI